MTRTRIELDGGTTIQVLGRAGQRVLETWNARA
jgi:hypothetical protein